MQIIRQNGHERVILERTEYDDLVDARDHAYLAAPSPMAYWRTRAGTTLVPLALEVGETLPLPADIEQGKQEATARVLSRIARALNVRIEDLVAG